MWYAIILLFVLPSNFMSVFSPIESSLQFPNNGKSTGFERKTWADLLTSDITPVNGRLQYLGTYNFTPTC